MENDENRISLDVIKMLNPLCHLTEDELYMLCRQIKIRIKQKGSTLIECGSVDARALFLLKGKVKLTATDGRSHIIEGETPRASRPISHLIPHQYTVIAMSTVKYIRVDEQILVNLEHRQVVSGEQVEDVCVEQDVINNPLFQDIFRDLQADKLIIPTLPDFVIRIRSLIKEESDVRKISIVIQSESALAVLLLKVANSAIYHTDKDIKTIGEAINRIGINALQNYVIKFALRNLFKSQSQFVKQQMRNLWKHSTEVAAISYVLASKIKQFDPDQALLLGLVHDIGILPILGYAQKYPGISEDDKQLKEIIRQLHGDIAGVIFNKWNFSKDFATVAKESDNWRRDTAPEADYCDLILVAQLFSFMGKVIGKDTPPIDERDLPHLIDVPAYHKLGLGALAPEGGIAILQDAKKDIAEHMRLLAS